MQSMQRTSRKALALIKSGKGESVPAATLLQKRILGFVTRRASQGATCDEIELTLDILHQTASPRVRELVGKGYLHDSGSERKTRSGRKAIVWLSDYPKDGDPVQLKLVP